LKLAVLFDGAGLARSGLEQAGHECVGVEIDPWKHHLSKMVGSGNSILMDATKFPLAGFGGAWTSPPCQERSMANTNKITGRSRDGRDAHYEGHGELLRYSLSIETPVLWVENVIQQGGDNAWGTKYNAAQFIEDPIQCRNRIIGGRYKEPHVYRKYQFTYPKLNICPAIMASQGQGGYAPKFKRAEGYYGRKMTLEECAYHMGFDIPDGWREIPDGFIGSVNENKSRRVGRTVRYTKSDWNVILFEAIGNGVPVYMAKAFGDVYANITEVAV
jgi:site-specific DNA-cytosine methylase